MGNDPATSILNEFNQTWAVPTLYVTDASAYVTNGGVGPTLTIMALTARAANTSPNKPQRVRGQMSSLPSSA